MSKKVKTPAGRAGPGLFLFLFDLLWPGGACGRLGLGFPCVLSSGVECLDLRLVVFVDALLDPGDQVRDVVAELRWFDPQVVPGGVRGGVQPAESVPEGDWLSCWAAY